MSDDRGVEETLDDRPELAEALRSVLDADTPADGWEFDDVPVDSGRFGELVDTGLVEKADDGTYSVTDPEAVRRHFDGEGTDSEDDSGVDFALPTSTLDGVDRRLSGALLAALGVVVLFRLFSWPAVYRDGVVVLSSNDPYYYRYHVETLLATGSPFDPSTLSSLPATVRVGEPLLIVSLAAVASLLGGTVTTVGHVLAWYPVVSAVVTAVAVFAVTRRLSGDDRAGLAAVLMLAVLPAHAFRTSLGFADHHAFDYVWLSLTVLVLLVDLNRSADDYRRAAGVALALGAAVGAQTLAWEAAPILLAPIGLYLTARTALDVRDGRSPARQNAAVLGGLALGAVLSGFGYVALNWHSGAVAFAPALLLVGGSGVTAIGELARRMDRGVRALLGAFVAAGVVGAGLFVLVLPSFAGRLLEELHTLLAGGNIVETRSLLSGDTVGWLLLFGLLLVVSLAYFVHETARARRGNRRALLVSVYAWYFLVLAVLQLRFAGELGIFVAVLAGMAFVHAGSWIDAIRPPAWMEDADGSFGSTLSIPDAGSRRTLALLFVLVAGISMVQVPVKTSQITIDDQQFRTAQAIADHAETQRADDQDYVLSQWGRNRMYNYFVSGWAQSYAYARDNYGPFMRGTNGSRWYERIDSRVGYVLAEDGGWADGTIGSRLFEAYGGRHGGAPALDHYRAFYRSSEGEFLAYEVVPGATISGEGPPNETVNVTVPVRLGSKTVTYRKSVSVNQYGVYETTVPYNGTYRAGGESVAVSYEDVRQRGYVPTFEGPGIASWSLNEGSGQRAYDRSGGAHFRLSNATWIDGVSGSALRFDDQLSHAVTRRFDESPDEFTISLWVRPSETNRTKNQVLLRGGGSLTMILRSSGRISFRVPGVSDRFALSDRIPVGKWTHVVATFNGSAKRLYTNGSVDVTQRNNIGNGSPNFGQLLVVGSAYYDESNSFVGAVDEIRIYERALSEAEIDDLATPNGTG